MQLVRLLSYCYNAFIDLLFPPACLKCSALIMNHGGLCPSCWSSLRFINSSICSCCGYPFPFLIAHPSLCPSCFVHPPNYTWARSLLYYDDQVRPLILKYKHGDACHLAPFFALCLSGKLSSCISGNEILVPVPLHWTRLFKRKYNQSALLSQFISRSLNLEVALDALYRTRRTLDQGQFNRQGRSTNVKGAFVLNPKWQSKISNSSIIIIDDVLTTGSTINECAKVLLAAGAKQVAVATIARVA